MIKHQTKSEVQPDHIRPSISALSRYGTDWTERPHFLQVNAKSWVCFFALLFARLTWQTSSSSQDQNSILTSVLLP